mgnify:CR=1 FL=1
MPSLLRALEACKIRLNLDLDLNLNLDLVPAGCLQEKTVERRAA